MPLGSTTAYFSGIGKLKAAGIACIAGKMGDDYRAFFDHVVELGGTPDAIAAAVSEYLADPDRVCASSSPVRACSASAHVHSAPIRYFSRRPTGYFSSSDCQLPKTANLPVVAGLPVLVVVPVWRRPHHRQCIASTACAYSHGQKKGEDAMSTSIQEKQIQTSRRAFIGGVGAAAAAGVFANSAALPALADEQVWDVECDFVVVGAGTGLAGALAAAVDGCKVIVLESQGFTGGTMASSGGVAYVPCNSCEEAEGIEDTYEDARKYLVACAEGQASDEIIDAYLSRASEMADFVQEHSPLTWMISDFRRCYEYHPEWDGALFRGRSLYPYDDAAPARRGALLAQHLTEGVEEAGGEIMLNTKATRLITRTDEEGVLEVIGVLADGPDGTIRIKAAKGVLLSAGGYDYDDEMRRSFLRIPTLYSNACKGCDGSGIKMAMSVGAALTNMNECWGYPAYKVPGENGYFQGFDHQEPGKIVVNRYGERFMNEGADYDSAWRGFSAFNTWNDQDDFGWRNLPAFTIMDDAARRRYGMAYQYGDDVPEWAVSGDTLAELAEKLGIDPDGLEATVAKFNEYAEAGYDPDFHRGESLYDRLWDQNGEGIPGPEASLGALTTPPFWGAEVCAGMLGTCGGAKVNENAQVIDAFGEVIPRLYASGNNSGVGSPGAGYTGGGATIGPALTFAYIAGRHAAALDSWK